MRDDEEEPEQGAKGELFAAGRARRRMSGLSLLFKAALLLALIAPGCGMINQPDTTQQPQKFDWDLSQSHAVEKIGWPPDNTTNAFTRSDVTVRLKVSPEKIFEGHLKNVTVVRREKEIESVVLQSGAKTLDEAYKEASRIAQQWGFKQQSLDQWYAERKAETPPDTHATFGTFINGVEPSFALRILHSFNDQSPWLVSLEVNWAS